MSREEVERAIGRLLQGEDFGTEEIDAHLGIDEAAGDLLALVGKGKKDDLTASDAREIGRKVAKMSGARRKKYLGMINALGGYYKGRGAGTAKLTAIRKAAMNAYNAAKKEGVEW